MYTWQSLPDNRHLNISRKSNASPMFLEDATYKDELERGQQTIPTVDVGMPLSTSTNALEKYSVSVPMSNLVNDEVNLYMFNISIFLCNCAIGSVFPHKQQLV